MGSSRVANGVLVGMSLVSDAINVEIWDATGSKRQVVQVPVDAPVNRFIAVLVERLSLPRQSPDGQAMSYKLHHRGSGRQLLDTATLAAAGVKDGDVMRLQPEITAGAMPVASASGRAAAASHAQTAIQLDPATPDGRFSRFELIGWWEQERLSRARVVVIGAGAIGNEIIKNLALLGIGNLFIADLDSIEESNLSRSVLFRLGDQGQSKAHVAARSAREIFPNVRVRPWQGNVVHDLGLGLFRWADVILCGLDNREARVAINTYAAKAGKVWVDGAIERLDGVARVFDAATGPCYECTMSDQDWKLLEARRSCALLTRDQMAEGKVPTTPTTASVIAGIQCQEVIKYLHGLETISGRGYVFEGTSYQSYLVTYSRRPDCPAHEPLTEVVELDTGASNTTASQLLARARQDLGPDAVIDLGRDMLCGLSCSACGATNELFASLGKVTESMGRCDACGQPAAPVMYTTLRGDEPFLHRTLAELGVPAWEILVARTGTSTRAYELAADRNEVLGELVEGLQA